MYRLLPNSLRAPCVSFLVGKVQSAFIITRMYLLHWRIIKVLLVRLRHREKADPSALCRSDLVACGDSDDNVPCHEQIANEPATRLLATLVEG